MPTPSPQRWSPPVPPDAAVGTGHRWLEPVSMEGAHKGVDVQAVRGTPALAPVSGHIGNVWFDPRGLGLQADVVDPHGNHIRYAHLDQVHVRPGQAVGAGEQIADVGSTGAGSTGPHLDIRLQDPQGRYHDPTPYLGWMAQLPRADQPGSGEDDSWAPQRPERLENFGRDYPLNIDEQLLPALQQWERVGGPMPPEILEHARRWPSYAGGTYQWARERGLEVPPEYPRPDLANESVAQLIRRLEGVGDRWPIEEIRRELESRPGATQGLYDLERFRPVEPTGGLTLYRGENLSSTAFGDTYDRFWGGPGRYWTDDPRTAATFALQPESSDATYDYVRFGPYDPAHPDATVHPDVVPYGSTPPRLADLQRESAGDVRNLMAERTRWGEPTTPDSVGIYRIDLTPEQAAQLYRRSFGDAGANEYILPRAFVEQRRPLMLGVNPSMLTGGVGIPGAALNIGSLIPEQAQQAADQWLTERRDELGNAIGQGLRAVDAVRQDPATPGILRWMLGEPAPQVWPAEEEPGGGQDVGVGAASTGFFSDWLPQGIYGANKWSGSTGTDDFMPRGSVIRAPFSGVVELASSGTGLQGGAELILRGDNGYSVRLRHVQPGVQVGTRVMPGQPLGTVNDPSMDMLGQYPGMPDGFQHVDISVNQGTDMFDPTGGGGGNIDADQWLQAMGYRGQMVPQTLGPNSAGGGMGMVGGMMGMPPMLGGFPGMGGPPMMGGIGGGFPSMGGGFSSPPPMAMSAPQVPSTPPVTIPDLDFSKLPSLTRPTNPTPWLQAWKTPTPFDQMGFSTLDLSQLQPPPVYGNPGSGMRPFGMGQDWVGGGQDRGDGWVGSGADFIGVDPAQAGNWQLQQQAYQIQIQQLGGQLQQLNDSYQLQLAQLQQQALTHGDDVTLQQQQMQLQDKWRQEANALQMALANVQTQSSALDRQLQQYNLNNQFQLGNTQLQQNWLQHAGDQNLTAMQSILQDRQMQQQLGLSRQNVVDQLRNALQLQGGQLTFQQQQLAAQLGLSQEQLRTSTGLAQQQLGVNTALAQQQLGVNSALAQQQLAAQIGLHQQDLASQMGENAANRQLSIYQSALRNPWLQNLSGLAPAWNAPGGPAQTGVASAQGAVALPGPGTGSLQGSAPPPVPTTFGGNPTPGVTGVRGGSQSYGDYMTPADKTTSPQWGGGLMTGGGQDVGSGADSGPVSGMQGLDFSWQYQTPSWLNDNQSLIPSQTLSNYFYNNPFSTTYQSPWDTDPSLSSLGYGSLFSGYLPLAPDPTLYQMPFQSINLANIGVPTMQFGNSFGANPLFGSPGGAPGGSMNYVTGQQQQGWGNSPLQYNYREYAAMSPFQRAAMRTNTEMQGIPWEQMTDAMRSNWAQQGGPTSTPSMTRLSAQHLSADPLGMIGQSQLADTFGEGAQNYWQRQSDTWAPSNQTGATIHA